VFCCRAQLKTLFFAPFYLLPRDPYLLPTLLLGEAWQSSDQLAGTISFPLPELLFLAYSTISLLFWPIARTPLTSPFTHPHCFFFPLWPLSRIGPLVLPPPPGLTSLPFVCENVFCLTGRCFDCASLPLWSFSHCLAPTSEAPPRMPHSFHCFSGTLSRPPPPFSIDVFWGAFPQTSLPYHERPKTSVPPPPRPPPTSLGLFVPALFASCLHWDVLGAP